MALAGKRKRSKRSLTLLVETTSASEPLEGMDA